MSRFCARGRLAAGLFLFVWPAFVLPGAVAAAQEGIKFDPVLCPSFPSFQEMDFSYTVGDHFGPSELPVKAQTTNWTTSSAFVSAPSLSCARRRSA
jgi:hypothetical protein